MKFINGENFMKLADICVLKKNSNIPCIKNIKNIIYMDFNSDLDENNNKLLKNKHKIFIKTDLLFKFILLYYDFLEKNLIIITHNSDYPIHKKSLPFIKLDKIKKIYSQNTLINHDKLFSIPIGIANSQWDHGNLKLLSKIMNENNSKNIDIYFNCNVNTNNIRASILKKIIQNKNIHIETSVLKQEDYWRKLSRCRYCICLPGNGIDTHRFWECIYLNVIPIIISNLGYDQFNNLPFLIINMKKLPYTNINLLNKQYFNKKNSINLEKADMNYWKKVI